MSTPFISREPDFTILVGEEQLATLRLSRLYREWLEALVESNPPGVDFLDPQQHSYLAGMQMILDVLRDGDRLRYRYRHVGSHVRAYIGADPTGIHLDEHPEPAFAELAGRACNLVVETKRPVHARVKRDIQGRDFTVEFLVLPVCGGNGDVDFLFVAQLFTPVEPA